MKALMSSWWRRFDCYSFWDEFAEEPVPLISFSLDAFFTETRPAAYYAYNDTDRWRSIHFRLMLSRRLFAITTPFKKLPDYVPTGKAMLRTRKVQQEFEARRNGATKV